MQEFKLNQKVMCPSIDLASFEVKGIKEDEILIRGDFSGGTHNVDQTGWVSRSLVYSLNTKQ